jgi:hypothetical protein
VCPGAATGSPLFHGFLAPGSDRAAKRTRASQTRRQKTQPKLDARLRRRKLAANGHDAKAILPEPRSVKKTNSYQFFPAISAKRKGAVMKGVGVLFDIDALGGGFYGYKAWCIFMRNLKPEKIISCILRAGDTNATMNRSRREFCIAVFGIGLDVETVKAAFTGSSEKGLAPSNRRFILSPQLDSEHLVEAGMIDSVGRLVQDKWSRVVHDECKDGGWGFAPQKVTVDLSPELKAELKALQDKTVIGSASAAQPRDSVSRPQPSKPWWKFWK